MSCSTWTMPRTPAAFAAETRTSMIACLSPVETPLVGSSSRMTFGLSAKALAISSSFFSPCDSVEATVSSRGRKPRTSATRSASACNTSSRRSDRNGLPTRRRREATATASVSRTVSAGKMLTSWNERDIPSRASSTGPTPAISRPRKRTSPAVGLNKPVTTLTSVVFPAPFGPTIETNSPSLTWNETLFSALNRPKVFETLMVSNSGAVTDARAGCISSPSTAPVGQCLDGARQTLRHEDHQQHQDAPHHKAPVLRDRHHEILQHHENQRADRRPCECSAAAKHGHEDQVARMGPIGEFRIGQSGGDRE